MSNSLKTTPTYAMTAQVSDRLAATVSKLGAADFHESLLQLIACFSPFDSAIVMVYAPRRRPKILVDQLGHSTRENTAAHYVDGAYLLDPFHNRAMGLSRSEIVRMKDLTPRDFDDSEYFSDYYKKSNLIDEINFLVPLTTGQTYAVSISRATGSPLFSEQDLREDSQNLALISVLVLRHAGLDERLSAVKTTDDDHERLEAVLREFGSSVLTPRECEVVQLMLNGYSMLAISELLGVSVETARVHRRNIYEKLNISSLAELFSRALETIYAAAR